MLPEKIRQQVEVQIVCWALLEAQQGRLLSEAELQEEYERRLLAAEGAVGEARVALRRQLEEKYEHMLSEAIRRARDEAEEDLQDEVATRLQEEGIDLPASAPRPRSPNGGSPRRRGPSRLLRPSPADRLETPGLEEPAIEEPALGGPARPGSGLDELGPEEPVPE